MITFLIIITIIIISIVIFYFINKAINYFENKNSILLDADVNKLIAENNKAEESLENALKPIIKQVNKAALKGKTFYIVDDSYHYRYQNKFSREEIESFFKKHGYKVDFVYCMINDSSIEKITW